MGLTYGYSIQNVIPISDAAKNEFLYYNFQGLAGPNSLNGITQSTITPTFAYNTVNHPIIPTRGLRINLSAGFAGSVLGGNVNTVSPAVDIAYFRRGLLRSHVMGFHVNGRFIAGYGGKVAPPYSRFYMGGEDDVRGFDIYSISPFAYVPTSTAVNVLNNDGTQRVQKVLNADGTTSLAPVTQTIPTYQFTYAGGDTAGVFNYEYRIPIIGPVTLAPFLDAGINRLTLPNQLGLNTDRVAYLNGLFPQADFGKRAYIVPGTQKPRVSAGLELQVLMPVVNAPFRLYWAYNLSTFNGNIQPPIVADRSFFANDATYRSAFSALGVSDGNYTERRSLFRFSVGRTF